jgi:hypothetical protein
MVGVRLIMVQSMELAGWMVYSVIQARAQELI